jgi:hypothetical protein
MSDSVITKKCSGCKKVKPISDFYPHSKMKDGHLNECKFCIIDKTKQYQKTENGKLSQAACKKRYRQSEKGKQATRLECKRRRIRNPEKIRAVKAINHAIRAGKLSPQSAYHCRYCREQAEQYHHHLGYAPEHWLDIQPVCKICHRKIHLS